MNGHATPWRPVTLETAMAAGSGRPEVYLSQTMTPGGYSGDVYLQWNFADVGSGAPIGTIRGPRRRTAAPSNFLKGVLANLKGIAAGGVRR